MKITVKHQISTESGAFDLKSFNKKANQVFTKEVKIQIDRAKKHVPSKTNPSCNNPI